MKMQKVTDSFELPKDIMLGLPTVRAADSTIKISGSRLEIKEFTKDLIIIAGHLKGVIYEY